ncbi:MAG: hypothetical protein JWQ90_600 [Hydrocarboniphaga sp.]|nr:hypothetical protein [Hydrocarboniphaga sp.]
MVETFAEFWPREVPLLLYHEGFEPAPIPGRLVARDLLASSPELVAFKKRHADNPRAHGHIKPWRRLKLGRLSIPVPLRVKKARYRWDAVRFSHKTFAIFHAARHTDADVLIWIDADTRFFAPLDPAELDTLAPADCGLACLRRPKFTECGFVVYNLRDPAMQDFLADFERLYTDDGFWAEREYHDSWLFDVARVRAQKNAGMRVRDLGEGLGWYASHVLINSRLGRFMDHMKGDRKDAGCSRADDLLVARSEEYWTHPR